MFEYIINCTGGLGCVGFGMFGGVLGGELLCGGLKWGELM